MTEEKNATSIHVTTPGLNSAERGNWIQLLKNKRQVLPCYLIILLKCTEIVVRSLLQVHLDCLSLLHLL